MMPDFFMNSYFIRTALFLGEDATGKKINPAATATSSKLCLIKFLSNALFSSSQKNSQILVIIRKEWCGGWDLNPRTSAG
jgi:hypothetical protein